MFKTSKKLKKKKDIDEHLIYILEKSTPYQRMVWLQKAFEFWKSLKNKKVRKKSGEIENLVLN